MRPALLLLLAGCATPRALWLGGDVHLANGGAERLRAVAEAMRAPGVVNLEGPIGTEDEAAQHPEEYGDGEENEDGSPSGDQLAMKLINGPRSPAALADAGIAVAGVENNHRDDLEEAGRAVTLAALQAAGVRAAGTAVLPLGGLKVVVTQRDLTRGVPPALLEDLTRARAQGDVLVATFHVSAAPLLLPTPELKAAVDVALKAGATVIAAHGTHALAAVERRGEAVIAWGLGNLAFQCACTAEQDGLVLRVELDEHGKLTRAEAVPISAGLVGAPARLSKNPKLVLDLLESLGSRPSRREADRAVY